MSDRDDRNFILGMRTGKQNHAWDTVMQDEPRTYLDGTPKGCVEAKVEMPTVEWTEPPAPDYREGFTPEQSRALDRVVDQEYVAPHIREWGKASEPTEPKFIDYTSFGPKSDTTRQDAERLGRELKAMALKYNIAILLPCGGTGTPPMTLTEVEKAVAGMTPAQQVQYCTTAIRRALGYGPDDDVKFDLKEYQQQWDEGTAWSPREALTWMMSPAQDQQVDKTFAEAAEKLDCPVPGPEWARMSGIDMILPYPAEAQPIGVDKADLFANGVVGVPQTTPDRTIVPVWPTKIWLNGRDISNRVVAGSVTITEPPGSSAELPTCRFTMLVDPDSAVPKLDAWCKVEVTQPAPTGTLTSAWFAGHTDAVAWQNEDEQLMMVQCRGAGIEENKMLTIKNNSDKTIRCGDLVFTPTSPKLPAPFDMIVQNGWLDCVAAPCRRCTEKYFAEHPGESLTPETPVWPRFFTGHDGITDMFGCLDLNHSDERLLFSQDTCDYYEMFKTWNRNQWTQGLLAFQWNKVYKNSVTLLKLNGGAYAANIRYHYQDLPVTTEDKSSIMIQQSPATAPFFAIRVNGRDITKRVRRETFHCESSLNSSFVEFQLAHQEGDYSDGLNRRDHVVVDYPWDSNPFQTPLFDGYIVEPEDQRDDARWIQYRAEAVTLPYTTRAHQGIQPNIPKPVVNPHGEFANQYPNDFTGEVARRAALEQYAHKQLMAVGFYPADSAGPLQADDLHLHGIASRYGDFTLHGPGGEVQMEIHCTGDDVLVLHLLHRGSNDPNPVVQPVLWVKRWGEVKVAPGLHHHMGDLAQRFWRAVAQVHRDLPQPVSPKLEAILAFLTERHMTLAEFDRQYYARPILHPSEVGRGTHETAVWEIMEIGK